MIDDILRCCQSFHERPFKRNNRHNSTKDLRRETDKDEDKTSKYERIVTIMHERGTILIQ